MTLNKIIIYVVIAGYAIVNVSMQINFFAGNNIWAKYYNVESVQMSEKTERTFSLLEIEAGRKAYYAKTAFLLILVILLAFNVKFPLGFSISFFSYASLMLIFFGFNLPTIIFAVAAVAVLASYFLPVKSGVKVTESSKNLA